MFADFMINAWIAASIVAVVAGVVGFFVVVRGMAFAAHALPLCAFPGAAMAHVLGFDDFLGVGIFAALGVVGITGFSGRVRQDVAVALAFVVLLGLGALFLGLTTQYSQQIYALLFGQVLGVPSGVLLPLAALGAVAVVATLVLFRPLLLSAVSDELAKASALSPRWIEFAFLVIIAFATSAMLPVVGALLVFSLMVGPASAARALTSDPRLAIVLSVILALLAAWGSIALSYLTDWPIGFFVGVLAAALYIAGRLLMLGFASRQRPKAFSR